MYKKLILIFVLFLGAFFRFYKMDWGNGIFFHPDERNIAWAVSNISYPTQMNPKFFAYGGFPIYLYYFTGFFLDKFFPAGHIFSFENYILIGRYWSAFFSTLTVLVFFFLAKKFVREKFSLLATFLLVFLPGVIQQAHFSTVETMISFFLIFILYLMILFWEKGKLFFACLASIILGLAIGTKIVSLTFLPIILIPVFLHYSKPFTVKKIIVTCLTLFFLLLIAFAFFSISSPFTFLDWASFRNSMNYETGVGIGDPIVFYTRQFLKTFPIIFQLTKIFPFALGIAIEISGVIGFGLLLFDFIKKRDLKIFLIIISFLCYFLPNAILFAKWTRFVAPIFFFFPFFSVYFISSVIPDNPPTGRAIRNLYKYILLSLLVFPTILWGMAFFSIYLKRDVRVIASDWIVSNIKAGSSIFFESGNVIDIPLAGNFQRVGLDFFAIDQDNKEEELFNYLSNADYFIIQSRRVWANYTRFPETHPTTAKFYPLLWSGKLGFEKIKEFDSFPQILGIKINDELAEESFTVFDHPHITIWKKTKSYSKDYYSSLF